MKINNFLTNETNEAVASAIASSTRLKPSNVVGVIITKADTVVVVRRHKDETDYDARKRVTDRHPGQFYSTSD